MASLVFVLVVIALLGWAVTPPTAHGNHPGHTRKPSWCEPNRRARCSCGWIGPHRRGAWTRRRTHTYHVNKAALRAPSAPQTRPAPSFPSIRVPGDRPVKITVKVPHASGTDGVEWNVLSVNLARRTEIQHGCYLWEASANGCDVRFFTNNANLQLGALAKVTEHKIMVSLVSLVDRFDNVWAIGVKDR